MEMELSECKFFYENGEKIVAKERFIEFYSEKYRKKNEKQWDLEVEMEKFLDPHYCSKMFHSAYHHGGAPITGVEFDRAWEEYMGYKHLLMEKDEESEGIFWDVYDKYGFHYRDVDCALWKYGHLFYVS